MEELGRKVKEWIVKEGIPLEYYTANSFIKNGFTSYQGHYVTIDETPREMDIYAKADLRINETLIRISHVVECKWAKNKPWIIFTSPNSIYNPSALIAQSIGNNVGRSLLWMLASCDEVKTLSLFNDNVISGFSGKQMQEANNNNDLFYSAVQSIAAKTVLNTLDSHEAKNPFEFINISFPMIVIDGTLFITEYDRIKDTVEIKEVSEARLNWRGGSKWPLNTRIDIVTKDNLNSFLECRKKELDVIFSHLEKSLNKLKIFYETGDIDDLEIERASRGFIGYPEFIRKRITEVKK